MISAIMSLPQTKHTSINRRLEEIYLYADKKVWQVSVVSVVFVFIEALIYDHLLMALFGSAINFSLLFIVEKLVRSRRYKNSLMGLVMLMWPILMVMLSNQLHEIRFIAFSFILILTIYQDIRPIISLGIFAGVVVVAYSVPVIEDLRFKELSLYIIREEDASWEKMFATELVLLVICSASAWLAMLLRKKSIADALNAFELEQRQQILESNKRFAAEIAQGNFNFTLDAQGETVSDELTEALEEMRNNLKSADQKEKQDRFINVGLADIGEILRKNNETTEKLTDEVLRHLVKYLKANQGALYLLEGEEDEQVLRQYACYAFDRKKYFEKEVKIGEGLLGQLVLEKEKIYMTDIPQNYVNITSGLGQSNPSCILLMPLMINEEVVGALELASFQPLKEYEVAFTEKVAVSIASSISSARVNQRTQVLLEQAQEQAEEMKAQEEEMRQNMEELAATQEEMQRNSIEMEERMKAIEASGVGAMEFDLEGHITSANQAILEVMGYRMEEVVGQHHCLFVSPEEKESEGYQQMWTRLVKGEKIEGEFKRVNKKGDIVYLKGAYGCIFDANNEPQKIIKLAFDVTENNHLIQEAQAQTGQIMEQEKELRANLAQLKELQDESNRRMDEMNYYLEAMNTSMITLEMDSRGHILKCNDALLRTLKYQREELMTMNHTSLFMEEDLQHPEFKGLQQQLEKGENYHLLLRRQTKEGKAVWFRSYYFPQLNEQGQVDRVIELSTDVTREKIQEEKIIQNEKILHERVKNIEDKAYQRILKLKKDMKEKLAEKDELIAELQQKL
jgi:methyl-accepting chemotaxis protein